MALVAACAASPTWADADGVSLVVDGRPTAVIYRAPNAPKSVKYAASEVQRVVLKATGAKIEIVDAPRTPMICLGDNPASRKAGLSPAGLPDDTYRIATRGGNVYIQGRDVEAGRWRWELSRGSRNGAFDFLERVAGVRWLVPGEFGEDVPRAKSLTAPAMDLTVKPDFRFRRLVNVGDQNRPSDGASIPPRSWIVIRWLAHQRLHSTQRDGRKILHSHSWARYIPRKELARHPAWRAKDGGKTKFCTSNPELVRVFAERVIDWLGKHPRRVVATISPTDGGTFCKCPKCRAQVIQDPHGRVSYAPVILKFYNDVARKVAEKHPRRLLAGYVYYNYMYPPPNPPKMEPNLILVWAPLNYYGWGLTKPTYRDEFERVAKGWAALAPKLVYHNYSMWMRTFTGAMIPPSRETLKLELPTMHKVGAIGAEMVGNSGWGYAGPANYVVARQMWDAGVDVDATLDEWFDRAYGPGAEPMRKLFGLLEQRLTARKRKEPIKYRGEMYEINKAVIRDMHLPLFPEIERLYLAARSRVKTEPQRKRLEMFGDCMILLHASLRQAGMLANPKTSTFYRDDAAFERFKTRALEEVAVDPKIRPIWDGEFSEPRQR